MRSDEELERAFVRRAPNGLADVYRSYAGILRAVARRTLGDGAQDADDCVHDVLVRVWLATDAYRRERGALRAFLVVCVRNEALARKRTAARRFEIDARVGAVDAAASERFEETDPIDARRLHDALATLPPEQREVVELAYFGDRTQSEIARELGLPLGTVKSRTAQGLRKLSAAFGRRDRETER